nr:type 1 glutamine amidotransferase domain-containing protein [Pseudokordiimonas caeni]
MMGKKRLSGRRIAFLATDGVEETELTQPWNAAREAGAEIDLISPTLGSIRAERHGEPGEAFKVDRAVASAKAEDYDGLVLPGGLRNPDQLRLDKKAVAFTRAFFEQSKPVAAICHGPWMLAEAGVLVNRKVTSWPSLKTDLTNAGASWVDAEVVVDEGLVTSRKPADLDIFCAKMVEEFSEGRHPGQAT